MVGLRLFWKIEIQLDRRHLQILEDLHKVTHVNFYLFIYNIQKANWFLGLVKLQNPSSILYKKWSSKKVVKIEEGTTKLIDFIIWIIAFKLLK